MCESRLYIYTTYYDKWDIITNKKVSQIHTKKVEVNEPGYRPKSPTPQLIRHLHFQPSFTKLQTQLQQKRLANHNTTNHPNAATTTTLLINQIHNAIIQNRKKHRIPKLTLNHLTV